MDTDNEMLMTAVVRKASASANAKGDVTYKLSFSYPPGFITYVCAMLGEQLDIYWEGEMIAHAATCAGAHQKPIKDEDPDYIVDFDCDAKDAVLANMAAQAAQNASGEVRFVALQLALFPKT